jgi:hypothetical protein
MTTLRVAAEGGRTLIYQRAIVDQSDSLAMLAGKR